MGLNEKVALMLLRLRMDANLELSGVVVVCFVCMSVASVFSGWCGCPQSVAWLCAKMPHPWFSLGMRFVAGKKHDTVM